MLLRQLKSFTKKWPEPTIGPQEFTVKQKLKKKIKIRLGKEALELADWVLMGPGGRKINEHIYEKAAQRQKKLCVGYDEDGKKLYRPAVKY